MRREQVGPAWAPSDTARYYCTTTFLGLDYQPDLAFERKGSYDRAIADYNEAIRLNPSDATSFAGCQFPPYQILIQSTRIVAALVGVFWKFISPQAFPRGCKHSNPPATKYPNTRGNRELVLGYLAGYSAFPRPPFVENFYFEQSDFIGIAFQMLLSATALHVSLPSISSKSRY